MSAVPSTQAPPLPSSEMHPLVPAFWVSLPVEVSRSKIATEPKPVT